MLSYKFENGILNGNQGDPDILNVLQESSSDRNSIDLYFDAAARVRDGVIFSNSIDTFIDVHRHDERIQRCGKLAIAKTILHHENSSYLQIEGSSFRNAVALRETWFAKIFKNLCDGIRRDEVYRLFDKIAFVVFNYDRCLEHFLFHAIQRYFGLNADEASAIMSKLRIYHPYGSLGDLPWQGADSIPFGFTASRENLKFIEKRIKTYTEQVNNHQLAGEVRDLVCSADTLVYLGFSYHPQNMSLLDPLEYSSASAVFGTALGTSDSDVRIIEERIRRLVGHDLTEYRDAPIGITGSERLYIRNDLTCARLLDEYSRSLFVSGPVS